MVISVKNPGVQRKEFGKAVERALIDSGLTRGALGARVAELLGLQSPVTQSAVSQWISGETEPSYDKVFAIEAGLGRPPGSLSRILGYLPATAVAACGTREAIEADPKLSGASRAVLLAAYDAAVDGG